MLIDQLLNSLSDPKSTPPYGKQTFPTVETGSKPIRGAVTEGRTLVIRPTASTSIQAAANGKLAIQKTAKQGSQEEAFSVHQSGNKYAIRSIQTGSCLSLQGNNVTLSNCTTADWIINYIAETASYQITHAATGKHISAGSEHLQLSKTPTSFKLYSVSF